MIFYAIDAAAGEVVILHVRHTAREQSRDKCAPYSAAVTALAGTLSPAP
jgi:hypothetical protein